MKIKDSQLKAIMAEVEAEIGALLKAEHAILAKAADDSADEPSDEGSAAPAGPADASADMGSAPAEGSAPGPEASASPAPEMGMAPEGSPAPEMAPEGDPAAEAGPVDPEALKAEYAQLAPEELQMHYMACKAALAEVMGGDPEGAAPAGPEASAPGMGAPPAGPAAAGPEASAMPPPAMKAEVPADMKKNPANGGSEKAAVPDAIKSEPKMGEDLKKSLASRDAKVQELEQQIEMLVKAVELSLAQPMRKAVTSVNFVPRTESAPAKELSKAEINARIAEIARNPSLKKSDRERIVSFSLGNIGVEQIKDLLETK